MTAKAEPEAKDWSRSPSRPEDSAFGRDPEHALAVSKELIHPVPVALPIGLRAEARAPSLATCTMPVAVPTHMPPSASECESGHLGLAGMGERDRGERAAGIALQSLAGADPHVVLGGRAPSLLLALPLSRCKARRGVAGRRIEGKDAAAAAQPERSLRVFRQGVAIERGRRLGLRDRRKAFAVEPCRAGRGDGPDAGDGGPHG